MANYYHVRLLSAVGAPLARCTVFTLSGAVRWLNQQVGLELPYQIINRTLKTSSCWAEALTVPAHGGACLAVVEDAGTTPAYYEQNLSTFQLLQRATAR